MLMKYTFLMGAMVSFALLFVPMGSKVRGDEIPEKYRKTVEKGLDWLASKQNDKGMWGANGDNYPISMTALSGMALLIKGGTVKEGKYAAHIRRAVDFLMEKGQDAQQRDGMIGDPTIQTEAGR